MEPTQGNKLATLIVEVFELTGQKPTLDDPVLVAALLHSELVRNVGDDAALMFGEAAMEVDAELQKAVKVEREHAASLNRAAADALQRIANGAQTVRQALQREFMAVMGALRLSESNTTQNRPWWCWAW